MTILALILAHFGSKKASNIVSGSKQKKNFNFEGFWCPPGVVGGPAAVGADPLAWWENSIRTPKTFIFLVFWYIGHIAVLWPQQRMSITK